MKYQLCEYDIPSSKESDELKLKIELFLLDSECDIGNKYCDFNHELMKHIVSLLNKYELTCSFDRTTVYDVNKIKKET